MRPLMNRKEVAEVSGASEAKIKAAVRSRELSHVKLGKLLRFRPEDVEAWINKRRVPAKRSEG